eukprot:1414622-Pyramimonas_sp.AAC.1
MSARHIACFACLRELHRRSRLRPHCPIMRRAVAGTGVIQAVRCLPACERVSFKFKGSAGGWWTLALGLSIWHE